MDRFATAAGIVHSHGRPIVNFASNDYLGLAADPRVIDAAAEAIRSAGFGSGASALVCGRGAAHERLERNLAEFDAAEDAVLFPSGYAANVGAIAALADQDDVVFCDRLNHASLIDGCRLSGAALRVYRHTDLESLERALAKADGYRRRYIVTDSVFSMDGDLAPLEALCELAERHDADLIVDEAHATGVFGEHGRGVCERDGVEFRVAVRIGTLSKALGSLGGFVVGSETLTEWLWNSARTQMFSTALPAACCAAAACALQIVRAEPERRARLLRRSGDFVRRLREEGLTIPPGVAGPIVPIVLGEPRLAVEAAARIEDQGFLVAAIRPPTVPRGTSRLRITLSAVHDEEQIAACGDAVLRIVRELTGKGNS